MPINPFTDIAVLIPAYNPGQELVQLVHELTGRGCTRCVIVNDGSSESHKGIFELLREAGHVDIVEHKQNEGKGAALKTGFLFIQSLEGCTGVITVDADGQHAPLDVERLAKWAADNRNDVILGARDFSPAVPFRSRLGNRLTVCLLDFLTGISLTDTQTGLRYLPKYLLHELTNLAGNGYEFELACLIIARERGFRLQELPIETIYIQDNQSSHFRPVVDSYRIYKTLFRFGGSSVACFGLDILLFAILVQTTGHVMRATIAARTVSGIANFSLNKSCVFNKAGSGKAMREGTEYFALWLVIAILSGGIVSLVQGYTGQVIVTVKIAVDALLFFLSFSVQQRFIFADRGHHTETRGRKPESRNPNLPTGPATHESEYQDTRPQSSFPRRVDQDQAYDTES